MLKTRIANYRPLVIVAIAIAMGIALGAVALRNAVVFYVLLSLLIVTSSVFLILKKKIPKLISIFLLVGYALISLYSFIAEPTEVNRQNVYFEGRVCDISSAANTTKKYVLEDVSIDGTSYPRKALVQTTEVLEVGDIVGFVGDVRNLTFDPFDSYSVSKFSKGINYQAQASIAKVLDKDKLNLSETIKTKLRKIYLEYMGEKDGAIALGLVLGDTEYIDYDTNEDMRASGLSHLFSVSGLHVGFMCTLIYGAFRLFRLNKRKSLVAVVGILLSYGVLTGFPVGVVRASIMSIAILIAELIDERNDRLNSLALATIIILFVAPLELFSVSFQLSIGAVFGIVCFYQSLMKPFEKSFKFGKKVMASVAVSVSANAFVLPISSYAFGSISLYFIIANLIAVPISSLVYGLLVPISILSLAIEPLGILTFPLSIPISLIRIIASAIATAPMSTLTFSMPMLSALAYSFGMVVLSKYYMGSKRSKIIVCTLSFIACALIFFIF